MLRKHLGISATEATDVLPAWEVDVLLRHLYAELANPEGG